ncbi:MAG: 4'-phosphopantetheinyl transferase superfamily protein [Dysgonamonadaceae bacterium]|jgi:3-oxoacyl-(acyl-carrier-protein) synthase/phosphopantetheinyl transferase (holo-ACP synthase)|nr:4'-phosphopantetheinyl transferase superfamily protein [Dysgonamonadaceae bacterium]
MKDNDIAIIGISCYLPGADNVNQFWNNLSNGVDSITEVPDNRISSAFFAKENEKSSFDKFYFRKGGFVSLRKVDPARYGILPIAAEGLDPEQFIALSMVEEALEDAGIYEKNTSIKNCSFILGKGSSGIAGVKLSSALYTGVMVNRIMQQMFPHTSEEELAQLKKDFHRIIAGRIQADTASGSMPSLVAALVSNKYDMKGPAYMIDAACASAHIAVINSIQLLLSGQCDIALTGGLNFNQNPPFWSLFNLLGAASHRQQIAPFSAEADGMLIGEGAGIIVLKKLKRAIADKDRIYAVIKGGSVCSDGSGVSIMAPNILGQCQVMKMAWENAGMDTRKLGYIEAHGTATQVGDRTEIASLTRFFGDKSENRVWLGSVKSNIGHLMMAAGIAGLIKTVLALYHKKIPPTLHCENPMKDVFESRFFPAQQLIDWDPGKYPLIAGVNAFGFGGINSHIILEAFEGKTVHPVSQTQVANDPLIALSAASKKELIDKLDRGDYSLSPGDYRLIVFNPTQDRIEKAKKLVDKDKPWKGRLDIWFSNKPLLAHGEKFVFMFPGFDLDVNSETQTISDYFNLPLKQLEADTGDEQLVWRSIDLYYKSLLIDSALKKLGIIPNIYMGHSIGEWHALSASGLVDNDSVEKCIKTYNPAQLLPIEVPYIAVGCGYDKIKSWSENIPDLYLANDNCPNQILMAGTKEAADQLTERLKEERIYYQVLPFQSASHTPLVPEKIWWLKYMGDFIKLKEAAVPVWSATSLDEYPSDEESFRDLSVRHYTSTVRFRELVEKLYDQESVKVFIQIGAGNLLGFVENTLVGKDFSAIGTLSPNKTGIEQFRRLLSLLFIEGKTIDKDFLGIKETSVKKPAKKGQEIVLQNSINLTEYPMLDAFIKKRYDEAYIETYNKISASFTQAPVFSNETIDDPVLRIVNDNLRGITLVQEEMLKWYKASHHPTQETGPSATTPETENERIIAPVPSSESKTGRTGTSSRTELVVTLDKYPFLIDHSVTKQKKGWPVVEDLDPVLPMAMTLELLSDYAQSLQPGKKVLRLKKVVTLKWIQTEKPFKSIIESMWNSEDTIAVSIPNHASCDVIFGDSFPPVPEKYLREIDLGGNNVNEIPSKEAVYRDYLFHGEKYQSLIKILTMTDKGLRALIQKTEGKGSLLDNLGSLLGLYLMHEETVNGGVSFPLSVDEIQFFDDINDQSGIFDYTLLLKDVNDNEIVGDMVIRRDGKVWCVASGFHNLRFEFQVDVTNVTRKPETNILAKELAPNVFHYYNVFEKSSNWMFLYKRFLNLEEKKLYNGMYPNKAREFLISRIALKDAVRKFYADRENQSKFVYPLEISVRSDENGKPRLTGAPFENIEISLAHKGTEAVAIASDKPVGIDIETIEPRGKEFMDLSFTKKELSLLEDRDQVEWSTRFWVAKEAYAKMIGTGLQGNPKQFEITSIDGDNLQIKDTIIQTIIHKKNYIIGWTQI